MDLVAAFRNEVFRPLMTLVVPGVTAIVPYSLLFRHFKPEAVEFLEQHAFIGVACLMLSSLAAGFLIENVGSRIEIEIDKIAARKEWCRTGRDWRREIWHQYLNLAFELEPIGQRYLRTVLLRMKFELHIAVALMLGLVGWIWLQFVNPAWSGWGIVGVAAFSLLGTGYLLWEAQSSAVVLHDTRKALVERYRSAMPNL